ncbi:hypothetical protein OROGR_008651 [Orobanche gracilis]
MIEMFSTNEAYVLYLQMMISCVFTAVSMLRLCLMFRLSFWELTRFYRAPFDYLLHFTKLFRGKKWRNGFALFRCFGKGDYVIVVRNDLANGEKMVEGSNERYGLVFGRIQKKHKTMSMSMERAK